MRTTARHVCGLKRAKYLEKLGPEKVKARQKEHTARFLKKLKSQRVPESTP
jgi:hypothetical protein